MKQLLTIIITFILLGLVSLLWDLQWIRENPLRIILVCILYVLILFLGFKNYNAFAKAGKQ